MWHIRRMAGTDTYNSEFDTLAGGKPGGRPVFMSDSGGPTYNTDFPEPSPSQAGRVRRDLGEFARKGVEPPQSTKGNLRGRAWQEKIEAQRRQAAVAASRPADLKRLMRRFSKVRTLMDAGGAAAAGLSAFFAEEPAFVKRVRQATAAGGDVGENQKRVAEAWQAREAASVAKRVADQPEAYFGIGDLLFGDEELTIGSLERFDPLGDKKWAAGFEQRSRAAQRPRRGPDRAERLNAVRARGMREIKEKGEASVSQGLMENLRKHAADQDDRGRVAIPRDLVDELGLPEGSKYDPHFLTDGQRMLMYRMGYDF